MLHARRREGEVCVTLQHSSEIADSRVGNRHTSLISRHRWNDCETTRQCNVSPSDHSDVNIIFLRN